MKEIWKEIKGLEGLYKVSNLGIVYSIKNNIMIKPYYSGHNKDYGYIRFGRITRKALDRLVYYTFFPDTSEDLQIHHKNGDTKDNRLENLIALNINEHAKIHGHIKPILQFDLEGNLIKEWSSSMEIQRQLGVYRSAICQCLKGKRKTAYGFIWKYKNT